MVSKAFFYCLLKKNGTRMKMNGFVRACARKKKISTKKLLYFKNRAGTWKQNKEEKNHLIDGDSGVQSRFGTTYQHILVVLQDLHGKTEYHLVSLGIDLQMHHL